jgi:rare lipoprotein A
MMKKRLAILVAAGALIACAILATLQLKQKMPRGTPTESSQLQVPESSQLQVPAPSQSWIGKASYYFARGKMGCANRWLPFGTHVLVTNLSNNRSVVLVVNDRGPFIKGRIIDVSTTAARILGFRRAGLAPVMVETITN